MRALHRLTVAAITVVTLLGASASPATAAVLLGDDAAGSAAVGDGVITGASAVLLSD